MAREKLVDDFEIKGDGKAKTCEACAINKGHSVPHKDRSTERINKPGSLLHLDTSGLQPTPSLNSSHYFVLCKDEASAFRKVVIVESKSEIPLEVKKTAGIWILNPILEGSSALPYKERIRRHNHIRRGLSGLTI